MNYWDRPNQITERSDASDYPFTGSAEKLFKSDQNILFQDLFRNYNREIHPVLSHDQVIEINFEIALFNVLELGEMTTNLEVILRWHDPFLTWDPALYNYTYVLRVPHHKIWEPDIILYNSYVVSCYI
ncbi:hypothetical protein HAZT_HAZT000836 [Hyalella azteca]|uniref:Neurotransmitter-gated ion-channel ligand-binding domain-containing protein n=1 Tax=Hyalella azteca TaxID=294128 RepID=A0A6A0GYR9_HYAAZ|nr:hypothetical protein HAZT_HAZT000836 [Hyalella azteca]